MSSPLRERWKAGEATVGAWCTIPSSWTAEVAARSGHDWVCIDTQHGLIGYDVMLPMLQAISAGGVPSFVRVPWNEPGSIMKALDAGAGGVIVPMVNSVEEARAGRQLLEALGLRERKGLDLIACPSCGRAEVDVIKVAQDAQAALAERNLPIQVAVMGCVVNGPGEARGADLGIAAGRGRGHLFVKGQVVRVVPEAEMVHALLEEAERLVAEGVEARLAAADAGAADEAERDRQELLAVQGDDPNASEQRVELIHKDLA